MLVQYFGEGFDGGFATGESARLHSDSGIWLIAGELRWKIATRACGYQMENRVEFLALRLVRFGAKLNQ